MVAGMRPTLMFRLLTRLKLLCRNSLYRKLPHAKIRSFRAGVGLPEGQLGILRLAIWILGCRRVVYQIWLNQFGCPKWWIKHHPRTCECFCEKRKQGKKKVNSWDYFRMEASSAHINHLESLLRFCKSKRCHRMFSSMPSLMEEIPKFFFFPKGGGGGGEVWNTIQGITKPTSQNPQENRPA